MSIETFEIPHKPRSEPSTQAAYRMTVNEREYIRALARALDCSETEVIRAAIHQFIRPLVEEINDA